MYMVVSRWKVQPGQEEAFKARGDKMRNLLLQQPEVEYLNAFVPEEGGALAIVGYRSKDDYEHLINDPNGLFAKAAAEEGIENVGSWEWSLRGEALHS